MTSTSSAEVAEALETEEISESGDQEGFSLTDPRTFSDGVWLDADRSEGEGGGVAISGPEEAVELARKLGPLPSPSETVSLALCPPPPTLRLHGFHSSFSKVETTTASESHSEGEFTVDQVKHQADVWVAPWRDPLLHLIALNAAGKNSKLPWNQQRKIHRITRILKRRVGETTSEAVGNSSSSGEGLTWVESMAAELGPNSPRCVSSASDRSPGEVAALTSSQQKHLRRAILAKSSERMRRRNPSLSSSEDEETLREEASLNKAGLLSAVKSLSEEEEEEKEEDTPNEDSSKVDADASPKSNLTFQIGPGVSSDQTEGPF